MLEVTGVRVERVQDISEDDAKAEGIPKETYKTVFDEPGREPNPPKRTEVFKFLWDEINKKNGFGWDVNPWVWVISFERITQRPGSFIQPAAVVEVSVDD